MFEAERLGILGKIVPFSVTSPRPAGSIFMQLQELPPVALPLHKMQAIGTPGFSLQPGLKREIWHFCNDSKKMELITAKMH
jgi:hypothetical protein